MNKNSKTKSVSASPQTSEGKEEDVGLETPTALGEQDARKQATMVEDALGIEEFLDRICPNRHKESAYAYAKLNGQVRDLMGLRKGESITDFLSTFRWVFRSLAYIYWHAIPIRLWLSRQRRKRRLSPDFQKHQG